MDPAQTTAIASEEAVAIATALHLYLNDQVHDHESYKITLLRSQTSWAEKSYNFRKRPTK